MAAISRGADGMAQQLGLDLIAAAGGTIGLFDEEVADDAFGALVNEIAVSAHASALDGGIARKNARIGIAQDHLDRGPVVPVQQALPDGGLLLHEGAQVRGGKMS